MKAAEQRHFSNARTNCSVPQPFGLRNSLKKKMHWKASGISSGWTQLWVSQQKSR